MGAAVVDINTTRNSQSKLISCFSRPESLVCVRTGAINIQIETHPPWFSLNYGVSTKSSTLKTRYPPYLKNVFSSYTTALIYTTIISEPIGLKFRTYY